MAPIIGISVSLEAPDAERTLFRNKPLQYLEEGMIDAVRRAGGVPVLLPLLEDEAGADELIGACDALLLSGGSDVAPESYGQEPIDAAWSGDRRRDLYEFALVHAAARQRKPVLGICRGCQVLAVAYGGTLWQDIATQVAGAAHHRDQDLYDSLEHDAEICVDTRLASLMGAGAIRVNSVHHQAIRELAGPLRVCARAHDGVIEGIETVDPARFVLGIQWHPEWMHEPRVVLEGFVSAASAV